MKNELQVKVIEWLQNTAESIGNFAKTEIPPFINEYLTWKFMEAGVDVGWFLIKVLICFFFVFKIYKMGNNKHKTLNIEKSGKFDKWTDDEIFNVCTPYIVSGIGSIILLAVSLINFPKEEVKDMVQIKIAPKVYLVEKCSELIKK